MTRTMGGPSSPPERGQRADRAARARAEDHANIDDVAAGQERAQREGLVELIGREPAALLDQYPPRPGQNAAEAGQRHQRS